MNTSQVKDEISKGYRVYKAFENALKVLSKLESLEQDAAETKKRLEKLKAEEDGLLRLKKDTEAAAASIKSEAKEKAAKAVDDANKEAANILNDAQQKAAQVVAVAQKELNSLLDKNALAKFSNNELDGKILQKNTELKLIQEALDGHKAEIAKFIKG